MAVIAGFQGLHQETGRISTLGARRLRYERGCHRRGDQGRALRYLYRCRRRLHDRSADCRRKPSRLDRVAFEEMLELASLGAKVLQVRSVELAMVYKVKTFVRSSFDDPLDPKPGTLICGEEDILEQQVVTGIAFSREEAQITLRRVADNPGVAAAIFMPLADANINVDMIIQVVSDNTVATDITFTVPVVDFERARAILEKAQPQIGYGTLQGASDVVKISAIGVGMRSHPASPRGLSKRFLKKALISAHHHVGDQILGIDRGCLYGISRSHAALALWAR